MRRNHHTPDTRKRQAETRAALLGVHHREFTPAEVRRMFAAREDGVSDADIAKRFGVSAAKVSTLIGKRAVRE